MNNSKLSIVDGIRKCEKFDDHNFTNIFEEGRVTPIGYGCLNCEKEWKNYEAVMADKINPVRIQHKRGKKLPPNTKLVTRQTKKWGNKYKVIPWGPYTLEESLDLYRKDLPSILENDPEYFEPLRGFNLACSCPLNKKCHSEIILEVLYG